MLRKVSLTVDHHPVFGNPAPLGLLGLAIASFAVVPLCFGYGADRNGLITIGLHALLFGGGCQFVTGLMDFANKNAFGGAIFTTFSFMWIKNGVELILAANGIAASHSIGFVLDVLLLGVFLVLSYGFGFFGGTLFAFLVTIDLIYVVKIVNHVTHSHMMDPALGLLTALLGLIALWLAFAALINPVAGRRIFPDLPPVFQAPPRQGFDFGKRRALFEILYEQWQAQAFDRLSLAELVRRAEDKLGPGQNVIPDLHYLGEFGAVFLEPADKDGKTIAGARLTAAGIDLYEQLVLRKYEF